MGRPATLPTPRRPEVRLVGAVQAAPAGPAPRRPLLVPAALLLLVAVVALSLHGQQRGAVEPAAVLAVHLDGALHLDVALRVPPSDRVLDARLLVTGAQERDPLQVTGGTGRPHVVGDLTAQCGPEGPLAPFEGSVLVRVAGGAATRELRAELPVDTARTAAEQECRPLVISAGSALEPAPAGQVRLTLRVRTRAASRTRMVEAAAYAGHPAAVLATRLPFTAGVPGIDSVTSFGVLLAVTCADAPGPLTVVLDGEALAVPLDPDAREALRQQQATACAQALPDPPVR